MPRLPRLQYPGAIYHIVTRGDGGRKLFHGDGHFERFTRGLAEEVERSGWIVIAHENHHRYWAGLRGGKDPAAAYRKFVKEGLANPPDPKLERLRGWVYDGAASVWPN